VDVSKAFDSLNHNILVMKLRHYGIKGVVLDWFVSYLANRFHYTYVNNVSSSIVPITHGVLQGSTEPFYICCT
jgi:hypothetical protein